MGDDFTEATGDRLVPYRLSGQQRALHEALLRADNGLAAMYLGAITVLQTDNPDRLALAAHGLRELMEKVAIRIEAPVTTTTTKVKHLPSLKEKTRALEISWQRAKRTSGCHCEGQWTGEIDAHLRKLLRQVADYFDWFAQDKPTRKQASEAVLKKLDPLSASLPPVIVNLRIEEWDACHDYFQGVAHHTVECVDNQLQQWIDALERFLLDRLRPRTFEDFAVIDNIILEGETDA